MIQYSVARAESVKSLFTVLTYRDGSQVAAEAFHLNDAQKACNKIDNLIRAGASLANGAVAETIENTTILRRRTLDRVVGYANSCVVLCTACAPKTAGRRAHLWTAINGLSRDAYGDCDTCGKPLMGGT